MYTEQQCNLALEMPGEVAEIASLSSTHQVE
jgi:hypothetical protein